jgi:hypothetical protein
MEQSRQKLSALLHGSALPPPPRNRALIFATIAAIVAAVACGMATYTHDLRARYMTPGIGVIIAMAIIRARGYGKPLMISASVLTMVSIVGAYFLTFRLVTLSWSTEKVQNSSFGEYLQITVGAADIAFALIAVLLAAGIVYLRTSKLEQRAKQRAITERQRH